MAFFIQTVVTATSRAAGSTMLFGELGKTFVTTNYDDWLDTTIGAPALTTVPNAGSATTSPIRQKSTVIYKVEELTTDNLERQNTVFHLHGSLAGAF